MNAEDRRRIEQLQLLLLRAIDEAQPGTAITLVVRLDRDGHVSLSSHVQPPCRYPLEPLQPGG